MFYHLIKIIEKLKRKKEKTFEVISLKGILIDDSDFSNYPDFDCSLKKGEQIGIGIFKDKITKKLFICCSNDKVYYEKDIIKRRVIIDGIEIISYFKIDFIDVEYTYLTSEYDTLEIIPHQLLITFNKV